MENDQLTIKNLNVSKSAAQIEIAVNIVNREVRKYQKEGKETLKEIDPEFVTELRRLLRMWDMYVSPD